MEKDAGHRQKSKSLFYHFFVCLSILSLGCRCLKATVDLKGELALARVTSVTFSLLRDTPLNVTRISSITKPLERGEDR